MDVPQNIVEMLMDNYPDNVYDCADEYGEPGYNADNQILFGDWWCRDKNCHILKEQERRKAEAEANGYTGYMSTMHTIDAHFPRLAAKMDEEGFELGWHDEWIVSHGNGSKAYRTQGDSYSWTSSILWTDGDFLTPDDGLEEWVEECVNDPHRCITTDHWVKSEYEELGFREHECGYRHGWYGTEDSPEQISDAIRNNDASGFDIDILYTLSYAAQFEIGFCVWVRYDFPDDTPEKVKECVWEGEHLIDCDDDGYCNNCGHQYHGEDE